MEICGFEIAKKLKEKGFEDNCIGYYDYAGEFHYNYESAISNKEIYFCHSKYDNIWHRDLVDTPTISQVLKWLRKKKNIFVVTFIADDSDTPLTYEIYMGTECLLTHHGEYFTLQEWDKCNLVGIEYCLDNLI